MSDIEENIFCMKMNLCSNPLDKLSDMILGEEFQIDKKGKMMHLYNRGKDSRIVHTDTKLHLRRNSLRFHTEPEEYNFH